MKKKLQIKYPDYINEWHSKEYIGDCILEGHVLNLITKGRYFQKPTYQSMRLALEVMKRICGEEGIYMIAMPIIGCGLDKLSWDKVAKIIKDLFMDTDVEILVCKQ